MENKVIIEVNGKRYEMVDDSFEVTVSDNHKNIKFICQGCGINVEVKEV